MFRRKKNASRDSAISRDSVGVSRDSSSVASPSAVSDAGSGLNTNALFINDYRGDHRQPAPPHPAPPQAHTPTSSVRSQSPAIPAYPHKECQPAKLPLTPPLPPKLEGPSNELDHQNRLLSARLMELRNRRSALLLETKEEEEEQKKFQEHVEVIKQRLHDITLTLYQQRERCATLDKVIDETETGYLKLVETSKMILGLLDSDAHIKF